MAATLISSGGGNTDAFETSLTASINVGSGSGRRMVGFIGQSTDATPDITSASQITLAGSSTGVTLAGSATTPVGQTACVGRWFDIDIPSGTTGTVNLVINPGAGSTARNPAKVLVITGNTETMNAEAATARGPAPNQSTKSGAMATIGTVCRTRA